MVLPQAYYAEDKRVRSNLQKESMLLGSAMQSIPYKGKPAALARNSNIRNIADEMMMSLNNIDRALLAIMGKIRQMGYLEQGYSRTIEDGRLTLSKSDVKHRYRAMYVELEKIQKGLVPYMNFWQEIHKAGKLPNPGMFGSLFGKGKAEFAKYANTDAIKIIEEIYSEENLVLHNIMEFDNSVFRSR